MNAINIADFTLVTSPRGRGGNRTSPNALVALASVRDKPLPGRNSKRQVAVSIAEPLMKRMRWLGGDRVNIAISGDETRIAVIRDPKGSYTLSKRSGKSRIADIRFANESLSVPASRQWFGAEAVVIQDDMVVIDVTAVPLP